jgi:hypothetical protein
MVYSALKGRIGNNLFQIAAGLSLAKQNDSEFAAYVQNIMLPEPDNCLLKDYLEQFNETVLRNIRLIDKIQPGIVKYDETAPSYYPISYHPDILIDGYFQSEKYFDRELIRETFRIDEKTYSYIKNKYGALLANEITGINIRRGDFIALPEYHPVCSLRYYRNAVEYIGKNKLFLIISDDVEWCRSNFSGENYFFVEDENPTVDLYLQSLCTNNIISNSSFSWWGAWLNPNPDKIVIAPSENWVGKMHPIGCSDDLLPESWIKLANPLDYSIKVKVAIAETIRCLVNIRKFIKRKVRNN